MPRTKSLLCLGTALPIRCTATASRYQGKRTLTSASTPRSTPPFALFSHAPILLALATMSSALVYYLYCRWLQLPLTDLSAGSFLSFAFGLLAPRLPGLWQLPLQGHWLLLTLICEPLFGTTDAGVGPTVCLSIPPVHQRSEQGTACD